MIGYVLFLGNLNDLAPSSHPLAPSSSHPSRISSPSPLSAILSTQIIAQKWFFAGSLSLRDSIGVVIVYDSPFSLKQRT